MNGSFEKHRLWIFAALGILSVCNVLMNKSLQAQEADSVARKRGLLEKIEQFQHSLKAKLDRSLCRQCAAGEAPGQTDLNYSPGKNDQGYVRQSYGANPAGDPDATQGDVRYGSQQITQDRGVARLASDSGVANQHPAASGSQRYPQPGNATASGDSMLPELPGNVDGIPMVPRSTPPPSSGQLPPEPILASDHEALSIELGDRFHGTQLGQRQITATEHAIRLTRENEALRASRQSVLGDNQRLKQELAATQALLERTKLAMVQAKVQLDAADARNVELERQVAEMDRENKRYVRETDQVLNAIREELDDVLVRELNAQ
ncbi:hypothetical protein [Stieleria varia]|uniref:Uncharacterized protein n=1 Tax=Stieleria varia TaxID=2528005 RepID=A0A5C6AQP6_9BACT|nr:hypothetical protein [Stieleria varia]TWU02363.1 hypothetical protein Pla52n_34130 [Stieleria varia]